MTQVIATPPTIRLRDGATETLMKELRVRTMGGLAAKLGMDASQWSRVKCGRSNPGPQFIASVLLVASEFQLDFYNLFETVPGTFPEGDE